MVHAPFRTDTGHSSKELLCQTPTPLLHWVMHGHESQFEEGAIQTLTWMKENVPGMVGWMLLKQIGVSAIGSFQPDPQGMLKATLGATPPLQHQLWRQDS